MNKKILIGSILVLTLLLLMPSIPAIQQNIVKDEIKEKILSEIPEDLDFKDIKELMDSGKLNRLKHPLLYLIIIATLISRITRIIVLAELSFDGYFPDFHIKKPVLFLRVFILDISTFIWATFWQELSDYYGWNWNIPY